MASFKFSFFSSTLVLISTISFSVKDKNKIRKFIAVEITVKIKLLEFDI
jgi:hypothetical protein